MKPELITTQAAHAAHTHLTCLKCTAARDCSEMSRLYEAMTSDVAKRRTPYVATNAWGRRTGCWTLAHAKAHASVQGGEVIDQTDQFIIP